VFAEGELAAGDAEHDQNKGLGLGAGGTDEDAGIGVAVEVNELTGLADQAFFVGVEGIFEEGIGDSDTHVELEVEDAAAVGIPDCRPEGAFDREAFRFRAWGSWGEVDRFVWSAEEDLAGL